MTQARAPKSSGNRMPLPRFDEELRQAKKSQRVVTIQLDWPLWLGADDDVPEFRCVVAEVDKYMVKVIAEGHSVPVWISKAKIVAASIDTKNASENARV